MQSFHTPRARRARAGLVATAVAVLLLLGAVAAVLLWPSGDAPDSGSARPVDPAGERAAEAALATRPMLALPPEASAPQPLATKPATDSVRLPPPTGDIGGVPAGFPQTGPGAVAALAALTTRGLVGADPEVYMRAYRGVAAPEAPAAEQARLVNMLRTLRSTAGLAPTGPTAGLSMSYQPLQGQIKGSLDDGRYVVACVLGQFSASYQGQVMVYGVGDCQAMRWIDNPPTGGPGQWMIAPGPGAAPSPDAWPGSQDSVNAGYRELK